MTPIRSYIFDATMMRIELEIRRLPMPAVTETDQKN